MTLVHFEKVNIMLKHEFMYNEKYDVFYNKEYKILISATSLEDNFTAEALEEFIMEQKVRAWHKSYILSPLATDYSIEFLYKVIEDLK